MMEKREFYKIRSLDIYNGSTNFQRANKTIREKKVELLDSISNFIGRKYFNPLWRNVLNGYRVGNGEYKYINDLVPEYMILEKVNDKYIELLTGYEVTPYDKYFFGVGVYAQKHDYHFGNDNFEVIKDINEIILPVTEAQISDCFENYNTDEVATLFKSFVNEGYKNLQNNKGIAMENQAKEIAKSEIGKQIIKKYTK